MTGTFYSDAGVSPRTNVYAEREMLKHAMPVMVLEKLGLSKPMPKNKTETIKFRRPIPFTAKTVPLQEGVTPTATAFAYEDVSVALKQYGDVTTVTDKIEDLAEDNVIRDISIQSGENIGRTMEALNYGVLKAGTNVFYSNGSARNAVNTIISVSKIRAVVRSLRAEKAQMINRVLDGSLKINTSPVEAGYVAVAHTDLENDIRGLTGFLPVSQYGSRSTVHEYELGTIENVRFILSPDLGAFPDAGGAKGAMVSTTGVSADVYPVLFFGREAFATVPLRGMGTVEPTILRPGVKTKDDPLGQRGYIGWKTYHAALILNQAWMARLEVAVTAL